MPVSSQLEISYKLELDKQVEDGNTDFMIIADWWSYEKEWCC